MRSVIIKHAESKSDLRASMSSCGPNCNQRVACGFRSSAMWRRAFWCVVPDVLKKYSVFIFKVTLFNNAHY